MTVVVNSDSGVVADVGCRNNSMVLLADSVDSYVALRYVGRDMLNGELLIT